MKKFFKSLAVLLVLAMVVTLVPAQSASAASSYSLTKAKKYLYIGGASGTKTVDGAEVACTVGNRYKLATKVKGLAESDTVVLKSADPTIAKTTKAGNVWAVGMGTTEVTVSVKTAAGKTEEVGTCKFIVKKNATADTLSVVGIADGDKLPVGVATQIFVSKFADGVKQYTDYRKVEATNATVKEVFTEEGKETGKFDITPTKAGEVVVTVSTYQSAAFPNATAKKEFKVTAAATATAVEQTTTKAFVLTLNSKADDTTAPKADIEVYTKFSDTVKVPFSTISGIKYEDNKATVTMFGDFAAKTTYFVSLGDVELSFVAAGNSAEDIDRILITKTSATANVSTQLTYKLYNALNIEITDTAKSGGTVTWTLATDTYDAYLSADGIISFAEAGKTASVKAKFVRYDSNYKEISVEDVKVVTSVAKASKQLLGTTVYNIGNTGANVTKDTTDANHTLAIGETGKYVKAIFKFVEDSDPYYQGFAAAKFWVESANEAIVSVRTAFVSEAPADEYQIIGNAVGSTSLVVYQMVNGTKTAVTALPVEVVAKRAVTSVSASIKDNATNLNKANTDSITVVAKLLDQYNKPIEVANGKNLVLKLRTVAANNGAILSDKTLNTTGNAGEYSVVITNSDVDLADLTKTVTFLCDVIYDNSSTIRSAVQFSVKNASADADGYSLYVGATTADTAITTLTKLSSFDIKLTKTVGGYYKGLEPIEAKASAPVNGTTIAAINSTSYKMTIAKNGTIINPEKYGENGITGNGTDTFTVTPIRKGINNVATKMEKGTYVVVIYKQVADANGVITVTPYAYKSFTITDSQVLPTFTVEHATYASLADTTNAMDTLLDYCFSFDFKDSDIGAAFTAFGSNTTYDYYTVNAGAKSVRVKKANVTITIDNPDAPADGLKDATYTMEVVINTTITK